jgi:hypothetical protein
VNWELQTAAVDKGHKQLLKKKKSIRKAVRELKKELKTELNGYDELNAGVESLALANQGAHTVEGH